jgi:hypothetical protein
LTNRPFAKKHNGHVPFQHENWLGFRRSEPLIH